MQGPSLSLDAQRLVAAGWRGSTEERYERIWQQFKSFLQDQAVSIDQISVNHVVEFMSHLFSQGILYSTICSHNLRFLLL